MFALIACILQVSHQGELKYQLKDANAHVMEGLLVKNLHDMIELRMKENPNSGHVKYHTKMPEPREGFVGWFTLTLRHTLYWKSNPLKVEDDKIKSSQAATLASNPERSMLVLCHVLALEFLK